MTQNRHALASSERAVPSEPAVNRVVVGAVTLPAALVSFLAAVVWPTPALQATEFWMIDIGVLIVAPIAAVALAHRYAGLRPHHLGFVQLSHPTTHGSVLAQLALIIAAFVLFTPLSYVFGEFFGGQRASTAAPSYFTSLLAGSNPLVWIIYFSATAAIAEEVVFRGLLAVALGML